MKRIINFTFPVIILIYSCSGRMYKISSNPPGALITIKDTIGFTSNYGETPNTANLYYFGRNDIKTLKVEKRGYYEQSKKIDKKSNPVIEFTLEKIDSVDDKVNVPEIENSSFLLLPVSVNVNMLSGVGSMVKCRHDLKLSESSGKKLNSLLDTMSMTSNTIFADRASLSPQFHDSIPVELKDYLLSLKSDKLKYYSYPPLITKCLGNRAELPSTENLNTGQKTYFLFVWLKSVGETSGRKAGNIGLSLAGAAVSGYSAATGSSFYYNAEAFESSDETLILFYVVDPENLEVVRADSYISNHLVHKEKQDIYLARLIMSYPDLFNEKKNSKTK